tara:strand:- start:1281 stop:1820 length:540 start_codon:yes stop_codon:yes gene_type:complete
MGNNGSGKTTTLRILARAMRPDSGSIVFQDKDLLSHNSINRSSILYLGHEPGMYSHFTSRENLSFALSLRGLKIAQKKIDTSLDSFDLLASANKPISIFSKGMLQRLKLVFADLAPWDLLLFDEPFSGLDSNGIEIIERQLDNWKKNNKSIIMVLHDEFIAQKYADRKLIISSGKIVQS